jgi:uncharacterized protein with GYD domain
MSTYIMMGKYSEKAYEGISSVRTQKALEIAEKLNGEIKSIHVLLGEYDVHIIAIFPSMKEAISASIALQKLTGISFTTSEAMTAEEFDSFIPSF